MGIRRHDETNRSDKIIGRGRHLRKVREVLLLEQRLNIPGSQLVGEKKKGKARLLYVMEF